MDDIQELYHLFAELRGVITVVKKVGQGTFSYVYLAHLTQDENEKFALKYIIPTSSPSRTKQEIECLLKIGGRDNVIGVFSVLRHKSHILIIMPYLEHIAFHETYLEWNIDEIREYIRSLLIALDRVHKFNIIHRDVKPSNFLYDRNKKIYALVDFGLAQLCENTYDETVTKTTLNVSGHRKSTSSHLLFNANLTQSYTNKLNTAKSSSPIITTSNSPTTSNFQKYYSFHKNNLMQSDSRLFCSCFNMPFVCDVCTIKSNKWAPRAGTSGFRSPEVLFRWTGQTCAVDVWSAGVIFLCLLSGRYPFFKATDDNMAIMQLISIFGTESMRKIALKYGEALVCNVEKEPIDLKQVCIGLSSKKYPDSAYDLLKSLLELDFEKRITAGEALKHDFFKQQ